MFLNMGLLAFERLRACFAVTYYLSIRCRAGHLYGLQQGIKIDLERIC